MVRRLRSTVTLERRVGGDAVEERAQERRWDLDRDQALLGAVVAEDVGELGGHDRFEAVVEQRPDRVLARAAGPEVVPATRMLARGVVGVVSTKSPIGRAISAKSPAPKPVRSTRFSQSDGMIWSGVDIAPVEGHTPALTTVTASCAHLSGVARCPAIAVAAATDR